jgi:uracil-DNA glycosylase
VPQLDLFGSPAPVTRRPLQQIREELGECARCALAECRTRIVFGSGDPTARLLLVGEAPGATEDETGVPFSGKAGNLLWHLVWEELHLTRDEVYTTNVVKCRPPENRDPEPVETDTCRPFLEAQVDSIRPRVIMALGKYAAQTVLRSSLPISRLRGQTRAYGRHDILVVPTFHPAYVLRSPSEESRLVEDLRLVRRHLGGV